MKHFFGFMQYNEQCCFYSSNLSLDCRDSDMKGDFWVNHQQRDPFYSEDKSFMRLQYEKARMKKDEEKKKAFKPRMIVHPQFQNFSLDDAIKVVF